MALTVEEAERLIEGQRLVYLGAYDVEYVEPSSNPEDGPGACHVKVTAANAIVLHAEFHVGDVVLAAPSELAWPS
jgi:hypothetical protein